MAVLTRKRKAEQAAAAEALKLEDHRPRLVRHKRVKASPDQLFNRDIWSVIVTFLDAESLASLAMTCRFFVPIVADDQVWKAICMRHFGIQQHFNVATGLCWRGLYLAVVYSCCHSYCFHEPERHLEWSRIGVFTMTSTFALAAGRLWQPRRRKLEPALCLIPYVMPGIWVADYHLLRCALCNNPNCKGTLQVIVARNWELFFYEEYRNGTWQYEKVATKMLEKNTDAASAGIFDWEMFKAKDKSFSRILDFDSWFHKQVYCPQFDLAPFGIAASAKIKDKNDGLEVNFSIMQAGDAGPTVAIRIAQHLAS